MRAVAGPKAKLWCCRRSMGVLALCLCACVCSCVYTPVLCVLCWKTRSHCSVSFGRRLCGQFWLVAVQGRLGLQALLGVEALARRCGAAGPGAEARGMPLGFCAGLSPAGGACTC